MSNYVNYQVALTPENSEVIDQINRLLISDYGTEATSKKTTKPDTTKTESKKEESTKSDGDVMSMGDFKKAVKKAKSEHDEAFVMATIKSVHGSVEATLGRSVSKIDEDDYSTIVAAFIAGPTDDLDDDDDDDFGDDDDAPAKVDPEAVKTALKAYAKSTGRKEAKDIMTSNGAKALSDVDDCSPEQLTAMMKALA